ncbi:S-layer homology domain-containing protein [Paenibacillus protaetiae]|uniref:Bifunctional metallophosphatase/5'-nucleotidase n=1 Tax=Paenibacillus protaetiae TaxID=2509456 RepID=A0A4V0YF58_9BACL|nr:S-layer homology domain-containing protein [Paenibacillus protaetiae]QAY66561.1 bifunctional metallophosphatase/5'-nucleotidase [Paenibacillus protaetiae]
MLQAYMQHTFKTFLASAVIVSGLIPAVYSAQTAHAAEADDFSLRILHTNDTHAHLDNIARRMTAIAAAKNDSTLLLDAGDVFSGTLYFNQYNGLADLWFMNKAGYDAMTFGNHEFDKGPAVLAAFMKEAKFPFVSANIDFSKDSSLGGAYHTAIADKPTNGQIYPAIIKEVNGEKVGIFGLTTPDTAVLSSPGDNITFKDYEASAEATVKSLEEKGINKIIALSHLGYTVDEELADSVPGIDVIVGGHSHTKLDAPEVHNADTEPTLIVQTGEYGQYLGQLDVKFDDNGVLTSWDGKLTSIDETDAAGKYVIADNKEAADKLAELAKPLETLKQTVIGKTTVVLDGERGSVRKQETNLGDFTADGMLAKVKSIVHETGVKGYVTIQNGGGIRASLPAGDITLGGLLTVMPFGNNLTALKMTGAEITAALENGVSGVETGEGRFPQVAGMRFAYDSTKPGEKIDSVTGTVTQNGSRIQKVEIKNEDGTYSPIDPQAYYIVATNSYMATGGDFYRSMKQAHDDGRFYELNLVDYEVFKDYLASAGTVSQQIEGRITDLKGASLPGQTAAFSDIQGHWAADAITKAAALGLVTGYTDGTFKPDNTITRAEFAVIASRGLKLGDTSSGFPFKDGEDIPSWSRIAVGQLFLLGIIQGYEDNTFRPSNPVTREEMTVMAARGLQLQIDPAAVPSFTDAGSIHQWAKPYVAAAEKAGLLDGIANGKFNGSGYATRAEVVTLLLAGAGL